MLSFLFILVFHPTYALGQKEVTLEEIDLLIENKELNQAVDKLDDYIKYNPNDFDNAQKRVEKILKVREEYKNVADKLVELQEYLKGNPLENNEENNKQILDYIAQLENMENSQNIQQLEFIRQLKSAAQFIYYNSVFEKIMSEGAALTESAQYTAAARKYTEGFTLYRDEFYESGYDQNLITTVDDDLARIDTDLTIFEELQTQLLATFAEFNTFLDSENFSEAERVYSDIDSLIKKFALLRNNTAQTGLYLKNSFTDLQSIEGSSLTDSSFLPFAYRLILGKETDESTGILTAIDFEWQSLLKDSKTHYLAALNKKYLAIAESIPADSVAQTAAVKDSISSEFLELPDVLTLGVNLNSLYQDFNEEPRGFSSEMFPEYIQSLSYAGILVEQGIKLLDLTSNLFESSQTYTALEFPENTTDLIQNSIYVQSCLAYLNELNSFQSSIADIFANTNDERNIQIKSIATNSKINAEDDVVVTNETEIPWENLYTSFNTLNNSIQTYSNSMLVTAWTNLATLLSSETTQIASNYTEVLQESVNLINEPLNSSVSSHPDTALEMLNKITESLEADTAYVQKNVDLLATAPEEVISLIADFTQQANTDFITLQNFTTNAPIKIALAKERVTLAERAQNEAELRFTQSTSYMDQEDFERAKEYLQKSREKFSESLLYMDSETLRTDSDTRLQDLGVLITRLENEQVVRLVRALKTKAKEEYYQGNFEAAESVLVEARLKWATTNVDPDAEIENILALVKTAISMKTGRVIYPTDPLYPEMSQILNSANQYYNSGYDLITKGDRTQALEVLQNAKSKLQELQLVYPLNQQASLLTLRIDKLINPDSFDEYFTQKYNVAKADFDSNTNRQQAYIDLLDLYEINPTYKGLKDYIYQAEITLGVRVAPPDRGAILKAEQLTKEAQALYNSNRNDEIILNQALVKLDQAIELDSDNENAAILKDRINTALGGQAIAVLPAAEQAIYQQAIQELQKGNIIAAATLVTELWDNPDMRRSPDVIDLKNKVDSQL